MPVMSETARAERVRAAIEAVPDNAARLSLPWRGGNQVFPVIELELDATVLNSHSHRIQAQLEAHDNAELIASDPNNEEAQEAIAQILRETIDFEALRTNLGEEGQRDPGVLTRSGLLVNANTRAVALKDLGKGYISVAVLPEDATPAEIADLELRLQVQEDYRQPYTFTNRLLFVDQLITLEGWTEDKVALAMRWAASGSAAELAKGRKAVQQATRLLALVREIQAIGGDNIPITDFDAALTSLEELDNLYQDLYPKDSEAADRMKMARILGILSEVPYRELRHVGADFVDQHLIEVMTDDDVLGECVDELTAAITIEPGGEGELIGLDVLVDPEADDPPATDGATARSINVLLEKIATSRQDDVVVLPTPDGEKEVPREVVVEHVRDVMKLATSDAKDLSKESDKLKAPLSRLTDAEKKLKNALDAYESVKDEATFDHDKFAELIAKCQRRIDALQGASGEAEPSGVPEA